MNPDLPTPEPTCIAEEVGGLRRGAVSPSPHLSPLALLKRKRKQLRTPACLACLTGTETRAAKRVRPRAIISHQITVSGRGRGSGGRQGWSGAAGVTGRVSPCRSVPHLTLQHPGLGVDITGQISHRSVAGAWDQEAGPLGHRKRGQENFTHQPLLGRREELQPWCRYGDLLSP